MFGNNATVSHILFLKSRAFIHVSQSPASWQLLICILIPPYNVMRADAIIIVVHDPALIIYLGTT